MQTYPLLTTGKNEELIIYTGSNKDVKNPILIFNVITGETKPMNPDDLALL